MVYSALFIVPGIYQPYFPLWLADRQMSEPEIAIVLSTPMLLRLIVLPKLGLLADAAKKRMRVCRILAMLALFFGLILQAQNGFWSILIFSSLMTMIWQCIGPIFDSTVLNLVKSGAAPDFGRMRLWGSISFALSSLVAGYVLSVWGTPATLSIYLLAILGFLLVSFSAAWVPDERAQDDSTEQGVSGRPTLLAVMFIASFILSSHATMNGFGSIHFGQLGYAENVIGKLWALGTISEIMMFWAGPFIARWLGPFGILVLASFSAIFRWTVMSLDPGLGLIIFLQMLHGMTFSASHIGVMRFFGVAVSSQKMAGIMAIYVTINGSITAGATLVMGPLFAAYGAGAYLAAAVLPIVALAMLAVFRKGVAHELALPRSAVVPDTVVAGGTSP